MTKLLGISGSLRKASVNTLLVQNAARIFNAHEFTLADIDMPLYNGDVEEAHGVPDKAQLLSDQIKAADAVIVATPEYNKAMSGALKNALDWVSRTDGSPWRDKPLAIMSAAAGRAGGERAQFSLRLAMMAFRPDILQGPEVLVAQAYQQFDDAGHLTNDRYIDALTELMTALKARTGKS